MPSEQWYHDVQQELVDLRRQVEQLEDRAPVPCVPSQVRLAQTVEKTATTYPTKASGADTFWIVFIDGTFTEAQGNQAATLNKCQPEGSPLYLAHCRKGEYYPEGAYVWVVWQNGRWWIIDCGDGGNSDTVTVIKFQVNDATDVLYTDATFAVDNVTIMQPIGATTYPGGSAPTSVNNILGFPAEDDDYGIAFYNQATTAWEGIPAMFWTVCP